MTSELSTTIERTEDPASGVIRFDRFATGIIYLVTFGLGATSPAQSDLWWLLRAGRDIWHTGHVSLVDHYSYTADGRYWPNHEWLWEAIAYPLHALGGMPLLSAWTGLTVAGTAWVIRRSSAATGYVVPVVLGALIPLMSVTWTTRPQVTSQLLFSVLVLLLVRGRYLWVPPLCLVWANLHAQVVVALVVLAVLFLAAFVEHALRRGDDSRRRVVRIGLTGVASALATLLTPLGPRLWTYVLHADRRPGQGQIIEWAAAYHSVLGLIALAPLLVVALALVAWRRDRLASWEARVCLAAALATVPLAVLAVRNIPYLAIAAAPLLMTLLEFHPRRPVGTVKRARTGIGVVALLAAGVVALVWATAPPELAWRPVPTPMATALRQCPGPLYNDYNEGAALIWFVPDVRVFVDNRQDPYPAAVIDASMGLSPSAYPAVFDRYGIRCALLPDDASLAPALRRYGWTETYDDGASVVLVSPVRATSATE